MRNRFLLSAILLLLPLLVATAQIPRQISYQGVLTNAGAVVPDGQQTMTISIYDAATGGTALHTETVTTQVTRGVFNVILGTTTPLAASVAFDKQYYLAITIGGQELAPRTAFTAAPYALNAANALNAATAARATLADSARRAGSAATADIANEVAPGASGVVTSVNGQSGALQFAGAGGTTISRSGNQITVSSQTTTGVTRVRNTNGTISVVDSVGPIVTLNVRPGGIGERELAENSVGSIKIIDRSITPLKLADQAVEERAIANSAVSTSKIANGAVTTAKIADGAVTNPKLAANAVTTDKILDGTILTADLADGSVTNPKLAPNAVTTDKILDGTIITADLGDGSVTNPKLGANAVTTDKILDGTIITADLGDGSVTTAKILDGTIATVDLADGSVTNPKLGANAVTTDKILDGTIATADIGNGQVTLPKITSLGATAGQAIMYDGTSIVFGFPTASSLVLPYAQTATNAATLFSLTQLGTGGVGSFTVNNAASTSTALTGTTNGTGVGVLGLHSATTGTAAGVRGESNSTDANAAGVLGQINSTTPGGFSAAVRGINNGTGGLGIGVYGSQAGSGWGVYGTTASGIGVHGNSSGGFGVYGISTTGVGVYGLSTNGISGQFEITNNANTSDALRATTIGTGNAGMFQIANSANTNDAVNASTDGTGHAIHATNSGQGGAGFFQISNPASIETAVDVTTTGIGGGIHVNLTNASNGARGLDVTQSGVGPGVFATSAGGNAVWGITSSISAAGVIGDNTFGEAVVGRNRGGNGVGAVVGRNDSSGYGVRGFNTKNGIGVLGQAGISGGTGTAGRFENVNAANTSTTMDVATNGIGGGISVQLTNASNGARGLDVMQAGVGPGVFATSAGGNAVWGITSSISAAGVIGDNTFGEAVVGRNRGGNGVGAVVGRNDSSGYGVRGFNTKNGIGVLGQAGISGGTGVGGRFENVNAANTSDVLQVVTNSSGNAARFTGDVVVNGDLTVSGTVAKGGGSFKIDHPLDPKNQYLYHSFVESDQMMNLYDGVTRLDEKGEATVTLPKWFEALNGDFRYQLTAIGAPGPGLYIAEEISGNRFRIAGGTPGMKVSWLVTGVRHDAYAQKNRIQVEVAKPEGERGTYLHPDAFGVDSKEVKPVLNSSTMNGVQLQSETTEMPAPAVVPSVSKANMGPAMSLPSGSTGAVNTATTSSPNK